MVELEGYDSCGRNYHLSSKLRVWIWFDSVSHTGRLETQVAEPHCRTLMILMWEHMKSRQFSSERQCVTSVLVSHILHFSDAQFKLFLTFMCKWLVCKMTQSCSDEKLPHYVHSVEPLFKPTESTKNKTSGDSMTNTTTSVQKHTETFAALNTETHVSVNALFPTFHTGLKHITTTFHLQEMFNTFSTCL